MSREQAKREEFDEVRAALEGRRITTVAYGNLTFPNGTPPRSDYGEWNHAQMGVELSTDRGPNSLRCTDTFWPYGIEATSAPMSEFTGNRWERSDASRSPRGLVVPVRLRRDFDAGAVWSIAGVPQPPDLRSPASSPGRT